MQPWDYISFVPRKGKWGQKMHTNHRLLKTRTPAGFFLLGAIRPSLSPSSPLQTCDTNRSASEAPVDKRQWWWRPPAPWSAAGCCNCLSVASKVPSPTLLSFNTPPLVSVTCCPGLAELPTLMLSNGGRRATTWFWLVGHIHPGDLGDPGDYQLRI